MSASRPGELDRLRPPSASSSGAFGSRWIASTACSFSCMKRASISGPLCSRRLRSSQRAPRGTASRRGIRSTRKRVWPCTTRWCAPREPRHSARLADAADPVQVGRADFVLLRSRCSRKPMRLSVRAASCNAATDDARPTASGEIVPGNRTAFRSGMMTSASSGIGLTFPDLRSAAGTAAPPADRLLVRSLFLLLGPDAHAVSFRGKVGVGCPFCKSSRQGVRGTNHPRHPGTSKLRTTCRAIGTLRPPGAHPAGTDALPIPRSPAT